MNVQSSSATNLHKKDLRHFLNMNQFSKKEILEWIELMKLLKDARTRNAVPQLFKNQSLGMIFQQNSTRTRVSFETAATLLGGHALMLGAGDIHLGKKETVEDTARVLARMVDVIMIRTDKYADIERFAEYSSIPIINAMSTDVHGDDTGNHPTQCLADLLTMEEHLPRGKKLEDVTMVVVGDPSTPEVSLGYALSKLGATFKIISPEGYRLPQNVVDAIEANNKVSGGTFLQTTDIDEVKGADFVMAEEWCWGCTDEEIAQRDADFKPTYVVTMDLLEKAGPNALFMHVLPANAGNGRWPDEKEVTREVLESDRNLAWDEAENRLSAMMALLAYYGRPHFRVPDPEDIEYYDVKSKELLSRIFDRRIS